MSFSSGEQKGTKDLLTTIFSCGTTLTGRQFVDTLNEELEVIQKKVYGRESYSGKEWKCHI